MSLLLDALKRAEQEKQARPGERTTPPAANKPALELAPFAPNEPVTASRAQPASAPPAAARAAASTGPRKALWIGASLIALAIIAIGGYVWYSVSALAPTSVVRVPAPRPIVAAPAAPLPEAVPQAKTEAPVDAAAKNPPPQARAPERRAPATSAAGAEAGATPAMLQPTRAADRLSIPAGVSAGYAALRNGDLDAARRSYSAALASEPSNVDAILGLATVEARSGKPDAAAPLYRQALEVDPRNATALAGLAALAEPVRAEALEQQLQREIAQSPLSAALHFTLGNTYASQSMWSQAQASYFEAYRLEPGNPDIAHNLAVSLDRMGQPKAAATYYRRALEAARTQATQFDPAAVTKRLAEIDAAK